jgi:predicted transcriptional regulator YheO
MRSSTAIYRDAKGMPYAALCINVDNTGIENVANLVHADRGDTEQAVRADTLPQTETAPGNIEGLMQDIIKTTTALEPAIVVLM